MNWSVTRRMFDATTKTDLIIEVWEKLDCESVGAAELIAIETALTERFGSAAVDSPMKIARLLADEGAELRHSEIMQMFVERNAFLPYEAPLRNILDLRDLTSARSSIRRMENLRHRFTEDGDKEGLRLLREKAIAAKKRLSQQSTKIDPALAAEIAEWLTIWLQSPEVFEHWISLRQRSDDYLRRFGPGVSN